MNLLFTPDCNPIPGRAGSLSLQLYQTYHRLLHKCVAVKNHALTVYKKNKIDSLLCNMETTIHYNVHIHYSVVGSL